MSPLEHVSVWSLWPVLAVFGVARASGAFWEYVRLFLGRR